MIELMKIQLGGEFMTEFVGLAPKTYSYWIDDGGSDKRAKWIIEVYNKMET